MIYPPVTGDSHEREQRTGSGRGTLMDGASHLLLIMAAWTLATASVLLLILAATLVLFLLLPLRFSATAGWRSSTGELYLHLCLPLPILRRRCLRRTIRLPELLFSLARGGLSHERTNEERAPGPSPAPSRPSFPTRLARRLLRRSHQRLQGLDDYLALVRLILESSDRLRWRLRLGTGDAAATAILFGIAWAAAAQAPGWLPPLDIVPDFNTTGGHVVLRVAGRLRAGRMLFSLLRFFFLAPPSPRPAAIPASAPREQATSSWAS